MNIKKAKEYIKTSVQIYLKKDEFGEYCIPVVRQRPIFLLGAPGIGKTAVMEQIAQEMGIGLVSYSMTHHTRQSALGLPFIEKRSYDGKSYDISEYTMSEIIATVYETMEESGVREGILFLDEINCVSETLAPAMLQFLQYKVFGKHRVPEGWVIVTAGNPPEYNKSVREFDVVTLDRLKVMEVEPDYRIWKEYALERGVNSSILSFLDLKKEHFYHMEMTPAGRSFVTARGWEDLSEILKYYEEEHLPVDETLVGQYVRNDRITREFVAYYELYQRYKRDYAIGSILAGTVTPQTMQRVKKAAFDERLSLVGMLRDTILAEMKERMSLAGFLSEVRPLLLTLKEKSLHTQQLSELMESLEQLRAQKEKSLHALKRAGALSKEDDKKGKRVLRFLTEQKRELLTAEAVEPTEAFARIKTAYEEKIEELRVGTEETKAKLHHIFTFMEQAFEEGNEMLLFVTELTVSSDGSSFIANFGSEDYQKHSGTLLLNERREELLAQVKELHLGD